jgi:GT2 family glycosyltransferase
MLLEGSWAGDRSRWVDWAIGAFLLIRRPAWTASGGFDPDQWLYAEDLDLGWRMAAAGWRTWFETSATVRHQGGAATSQLWGEDQDVRWQRSTYAWMLRRRGLAITRAVALVNTLGAGARALIWTVPARLGDGRRADRERSLRRWTRLHGQNLLASRAELESHR